MSSTQRSQSSYLNNSNLNDFNSNDSNLSHLLKQPQRYELLQAVRIIHQKRKLGYNTVTIKYRASLSLAFPLAEIESMKVLPQETFDNLIGTNTIRTQIELYPSIIGLTGPLSALPSLYTDFLSSRVIHAKDKAAPEFLDMFNHRLTELYVDASWFYNLPLQYELNSKKDKYLLCLRSLAQQPKKVTSIDSLIAYAGVIVPGRVTAHQVSHVLSRFLGLKVAVEEFVPEWFELPSEEQTALGEQNSALGLSTFCGSRVVQYDTKIKIIIYQLASDFYLRLLPNGDMYRLIVDFVRKWCGVMMAVEVQLELDKQYIKAVSLSETSFGSLGRGGFLMSKPAESNYVDTRYLLPIEAYGSQ